MVHNSTVVCFESHLVAGLGLPPSKFLISIMNFLRCELIHLNPNTITALICFTILCECSLRITSNTSMFWYFYSLARYDKTIFSGIGLLLCHHHRKEYPDATFKGSWKGASQKWFLVDMHVLPQWVKKHLLPLHINDKRGEPKMTLRLAPLVNWVTELYKADLRACHCVEEFTLQRIHPLGRREKLAYECSWLIDPSRDHVDGKILTSFIVVVDLTF
jgi:hypothetical protein